MWLELDGDGPLHRQTYRALRAAILDGRLARGTRLPATRALAREARLARNTVLAAYEQLRAEGYAEARRGSGTYVAPELPDELLAATPDGPSAAARSRAALRTSALGRRARRAWRRAGPRGVSWAFGGPRLEFDFRYGDPLWTDLPVDDWARVLARRARRATRRELAYGPPGGAPELREALAEHVARTRGVVCRPEQVVVVSGSQQAVDLAARVLVDPGDSVVLEEPGYPGFRHALALAGARPAHVAADEDGLCTQRLARIRRASLVCVTPGHQFPGGGVLPLARRLELLGWARRAGAAVLEDDYDGEYRFDGRPLASLQSLDGGERVIYVGTFSKLLFPALRVGYAVLPEPLLEAFLAAKAFADTGSPQVEQFALAEFIAEGLFERHVRRTRTRIAARRAVLLEAVRAHLGERARVQGANAGLHVVLWLPGTPAREVPALRRRAAARGVGVYPIAPYYARRPPREAGLLLGTATLGEDAIREGVRRLADALG